MSRAASTAVQNSFTNGWVTDATGLNFPENAVTESDNIVFRYNGEVHRRNGIKFETDYQDDFPTISSSTLFSEYVWEAPAGDGNLTFIIQQIGEQLFVYSSSAGALSGNRKTILDLSSERLGSLDSFRSKQMQFSSGMGRLFVTHPEMDPVYITYNTVDGTFSVSKITIQTRDTVGLPGSPVPRQTFLEDRHRYNLLNQGWDMGKAQKMRDLGGFFPSDYDVWWLYKTPDALGTEVFLTDVAANSGILSQIDRGNSPAPKGSLILTEFYQDRGALTGIGSIPVVSAGIKRPKTNAFFAGRVFYAGVSSQDFNSKIYFSQIIEHVDQAALCYQQNDPTSQYSSDLLPTDGGVISIPEIGEVLKLWPMEGSLLVFCSNGLWQITGSQGIGFAANDYTVKRLSKQETLSSMSFVNVLGVPLWWGTDGIYSVIIDSVGSLQVKSVSLKKIDDYYLTLPNLVKLYAKGAYNQTDKLIYWLYRETVQSTVNDNQKYTKVLAYDLRSEAFYKFSFETDVAALRGIFSSQGIGSTDYTEDVVDNSGVSVTANDTSLVQVIRQTSNPIPHIFKFSTTYTEGSSTFTFSELTDTSFIDWESEGGSEASASFSSGYILRGEGQRKFQNNYLTLFLDNETPNQFVIRNSWDYSNSLVNKRWGAPQIVSSYKEGYDYRVRRLKMRGHGKVMQYQIESLPGQTIGIIGWSAWDTTNGSL